MNQFDHLVLFSNRRPERLTKSATTRLVQHVEKCVTMSSSDEEEDIDFGDDTEPTQNSTNTSEFKAITHRFVQPVGLFRFVTRLNGRHSLAKMSKDKELQTKVIDVWSNGSQILDITQMADDSDIEDDDNDVKSSNLIIQKEEQQHTDIDLNDIREKVVEYDRQQLKGIQLSNAGNGNLRVVNNYAVTSNTCTLI